MQVRKALVIALVVLATSAFLLPLTASAVNWSSPFSVGGGGVKPAVALDADGTQHYVWWTSDGKIQYARCTGQGGNGCSNPQNLPTAGASYYPNIAIDPQGRPNVVFESKTTDDKKYAVYWTRKQGSNWSSPKKITTETYSELPDIAIGPGGVIHVIYQSKQNDTGYIYYTKSNGGFEFEPAIELDASQSDAPLTEFGKLAADNGAAESTKLSNGFYPRIAADQNDDAHAVWNLPSPYGIKYRYQTDGSFGGTLNVASGQKDQTPDVTIAPNGAVGIIWGTYDDGNDAFAEYDGNTKTNSVNDIDGGLAQSLWPKISADCNNKFHLVFQGSVNADSKWNIYHRTYDPATDTLGNRETIASLADKSEQTPAIDATDVAAIVYTNSTNGIIDASTANLGISCSNETPTPTNTATVTNTPDPNITPTLTNTPTNTPPPGNKVRVNDSSSQIVYSGTWSVAHNSPSCLYKNDFHYAEPNSGNKAKLTYNGTKVKVWFVSSATMGTVQVLIDDTVVKNKDLNAATAGCTSYTSAALPYGTHTVEIRPKGSAGRISLDVITVYP